MTMKTWSRGPSLPWALERLSCIWFKIRPGRFTSPRRRRRLWVFREHSRPWRFLACPLRWVSTLPFLGASHSIAIWTTSHFLSTTISRPPPCPDPFAADYETAQLQSTKSTCVLPYPSPPWNICSLVTQPTLSCLKLWAEINRRSSTIAHGPLAAR